MLFKAALLRLGGSARDPSKYSSVEEMVLCGPGVWCFPEKSLRLARGMCEAQHKFGTQGTLGIRGQTTTTAQ